MLSRQVHLGIGRATPNASYTYVPNELPAEETQGHMPGGRPAVETDDEWSEKCFASSPPFLASLGVPTTPSVSDCKLALLPLSPFAHDK